VVDDPTDLCHVWICLPRRPEEHDYLVFYDSQSVHDEIQAAVCQQECYGVSASGEQGRSSGAYTQSILHFSRFQPAVTANSPQWNPDQAATKKPSWYEFHQEPKPPRRKVNTPRENAHPRTKEIVDAVSGVLGSVPSGRYVFAFGTVFSGWFSS